jgi:predicted chitinase
VSGVGASGGPVGAPESYDVSQIQGGEYGEASLIQAMDAAGIVDPKERAMFLAQMRHESGNFKYDEEIGGGHDYYDGGKRYRGRGYIQLTHKYNYKTYGDMLGIDLVNNPELAKDPKIAAQIAVLYWRERVNKEAARGGDVSTVTRNIQGGQRGLSQRQSYYDQYLREGVPAAKTRPPSEVPSSTKRMSGGIVEHLHGDPGRSGYDYGGHGRESNAHDHFAFASKDLRLAVQRDLASGKGPSGRKWQIGSTTGGKHAPNSYHYVGQAFDVPWSQFGSGAIGQSDYEQSRQLKADVDALVRKYTQQKPTPKKPPSEVSSSVSATPSYQKVAVAAPVEQPPSTPIVIGGGGQQMVASGPSRRDLTNRSSQVRFNSRLWSA